VLAGSADVATFVGEQTRLHWPGHYDLRRIGVHDPVPVYPHSLLWRSGNQHPALAALRRHFGSRRVRQRDAATWTPAWADPGSQA
jgi:hypothetical protein